MAKQAEYVRYTIRVPSDIYEPIAKAADENGRSINAEIVQRLELTVAADARKVEGITNHVFAEFSPKAPNITIHVEALPDGEEPVAVSVLQFIHAFSKALRTGSASETSEVERQDPGPKLLSPDELDTSNDD